MKNIMPYFYALILMSAIYLPSYGQVDINYQLPPREILELADAPLTPALRLDREGEWMLLLGRDAYKSLDELSAPEYRLAGLRINPSTNGSSRDRFYNNITVKKLRSQEETRVELPADARIGNLATSPDNHKVAFTMTVKDGIELWVLDVERASAWQLTGPVISDAIGYMPFQWDADNNSLVCKLIPEERGELFETSRLPAGPIVSENTGNRAPARTYQDLLQNKEDEANFEYFCTSTLARIDLEGMITVLTEPMIISSFELSPDGNYFMLDVIRRPFSYLVPYYRFAYSTLIYERNGKLVRSFVDIPVAEVIPTAYDAARKGPRNISWRDDRPAEVYWVEALDDGDPAVEADKRDALYATGYPFDITLKRLILKTTRRFSYISWGNEHTAIARDYWWKTRQSTVYLIDPSKENPDPAILFDLNTEDLYNNPGSWVTRENEFGRQALLFDGRGRLFLIGEGYGPEGNRPFLDAYRIDRRTTERLYQAAGTDSYERIIDVLDINKGEIITSIESVDEAPQFYIRNIYKRIAPLQVTRFDNPYEIMAGVKKEFIRYTRDDGVDLTATLYLPPGYDPETDGRLPMLMWAYPVEYKDADAAGQVKSSPYQFTRPYYGSPVYWGFRGYAILDRADFPIIGEGKDEPNDTFIPQLVANARAAIDHVSGLGMADPARVAIGGHSYGAFMTANLLSHSDLFAAGIARSGAYNRTLTPFGFQSEERSYWEAPEIYNSMSPFMHADKMKYPLLLIHGDADNNSGTHTMQSERYYNALKGHGATVRLVLLPYESHGYVARENIMHMLWEQDEWMEKYVKNKKETENSMQ